MLVRGWAVFLCKYQFSIIMCDEYTHTKIGVRGLLIAYYPPALFLQRAPAYIREGDSTFRMNFGKGGADFCVNISLV